MSVRSQYVEDEMFLKPMNCPGHCLLFAARARSYRDLPLRMADFGVLHRNEYSGALSGLTRVRRFVQDDAHIFAAESQISSEVAEFVRLLKEIYADFGFGDDLSGYFCLAAKPPHRFAPGPCPG